MSVTCCASRSSRTGHGSARNGRDYCKICYQRLPLALERHASSPKACFQALCFRSGHFQATNAVQFLRYDDTRVSDSTPPTILGQRHCFWNYRGAMFMSSSTRRIRASPRNPVVLTSSMSFMRYGFVGGSNAHVTPPSLVRNVYSALGPTKAIS